MENEKDEAEILTRLEKSPLKNFVFTDNNKIEIVTEVKTETSNLVGLTSF